MKGMIVINRELCKGCGYCITACTKGLISLDEGFNTMGYHPAIATNVDSCNGCGMCAVMCPDMAIEVWRDEDKKD